MTSESDAASSVRVNVNVPAHLWAKFEETAQAHYRTRSDHLRFLMAKAVREHEQATAGIGRAKP